MQTETERSIERKLDRLLMATESLDRTVRGSEIEGNRGVLGVVEDHEVRISTLERSVLTMRAKVAGAGAIGGALGTAVALLGFFNNGGG